MVWFAGVLLKPLLTQEEIEDVKKKGRPIAKILVVVQRGPSGCRRSFQKEKSISPQPEFDRHEKLSLRAENLAQVRAPNSVVVPPEPLG